MHVVYGIGIINFFAGVLQEKFSLTIHVYINQNSLPNGVVARDQMYSSWPRGIITFTSPLMISSDIGDD